MSGASINVMYHLVRWLEVGKWLSRGASLVNCCLDAGCWNVCVALVCCQTAAMVASVRAPSFWGFRGIICCRACNLLRLNGPASWGELSRNVAQLALCYIGYSTKPMIGWTFCIFKRVIKTSNEILEDEANTRLEVWYVSSPCDITKGRNTESSRPTDGRVSLVCVIVWCQPVQINEYENTHLPKKNKDKNIAGAHSEHSLWFFASFTNPLTQQTSAYWEKKIHLCRFASVCFIVFQEMSCHTASAVKH